MTDLNPVRTIVYFDSELIDFETIYLYQAFNIPHRFEITLNYGSAYEVWMRDPVKLSNYVGQEVFIKFKHLTTGYEQCFNGIITEVLISGDLGNGSGGIRVLGGGDPILLEGNLEKRSFTNKSQDDIVQEILGDFRNISYKSKSRHQHIIPYAAQYNETAFSFLDRLSRTYGEWFYFDGCDLVYGRPDFQEELILDYPADIPDMQVQSKIQSRNIHKYSYDTEQDILFDSTNDPSVKTGINMLQKLISTSDRLFARDFRTEVDYYVDSSHMTYKAAEQESASYVGNMLCVKGSTRTCKAKLGCYVNFHFPQTMDLRSLGEYLIVEIEHIVVQNGQYSNVITARPSNPEYIPPKPLTLQPAYPEPGVVISNKDPKCQGRVKVQFEWQRSLMETDWLLVQTPDAGSSDRVGTNRGFVFIPEEGDRVMVGYEHGNPDKPFVMGSLFHGKNGKGGEEENHLKSIITRSGHTLEFNDDEKGDWGITIKDANGNTIRLDTKGKNMEITAPETISIKSKNLEILATERIDVYSKLLNTELSELMQVQAKESTVDVKETYTFRAQEADILGEHVQIQSSKENLNLSSGKEVVTNSKTKKIKLS